MQMLDVMAEWLPEQWVILYVVVGFLAGGFAYRISFIQNRLHTNRNQIASLSGCLWLVLWPLLAPAITFVAGIAVVAKIVLAVWKLIFLRGIKTNE